MTDNRTQTGFEVDAGTLEEAKERCEHGELSEELRRTVKELAYGRDKTKREQLKQKLAEKRDAKREKEAELQRIRTERNELERDIEAVEREIDQLHDTEAEYDGMLEALSSDLQDGIRVWGTMSSVGKAARISGQTTAEVMQDLKERNPDIPDIAFREAPATEEANWRAERGGW